MPYVNDDDRDDADDAVGLGINYQDRNIRRLSKGQLNYLITKLLNAWAPKGSGYDVLSSAIAAARDAADEFKRRRLDPHEDKKIEENGDVYGEFI